MRVPSGIRSRAKPAVLMFSPRSPAPTRSCSNRASRKSLAHEQRLHRLPGVAATGRNGLVGSGIQVVGLGGGLLRFAFIR
ncbi:hypothetical protein ACVWWG_004609 [Bradyrhizobium sp. LB7.2]